MNRKTTEKKPPVTRLLTLGVAALLLALTSLSALAQDPNQGTQEQFIGAWRLLWLEEPGSDGAIHRVDCTGLLVYTRDGHMSVQVMYRNPQPATSAAPVQYAQGGYEASYGKYEIDDAHTFTYHVDAALVRTLIGKDLKRVYALSGTQLIVKSPDPAEHWRVAWERY